LVLIDLGDYEGARTLLEKAVASDEKNFGTEHPNTAHSYSNLALVLQNLGDYEGALKLSGKALSVFENVLPEGHPYIDIARQNYELIKSKLNKK
jgi:tetratricopeptide (TPR) repeat protein